MNIGLVACAKEKAAMPMPAAELYISPLFRKAAAYCWATYDEWYILSAKYGLVDPTTTIEPYDVTLLTMTPTERKAWAERVMEQLRAGGIAGEQFFFHAGRFYRQYLEPQLYCKVPLLGLGIGQQLAWYKERGY